MSTTANDLQTKAETLRLYFEGQTDCEVALDWRELDTYRFYFKKGEATIGDWNNILDVTLTNNEEGKDQAIIDKLTAAHWRERLDSCSRKCIPHFNEEEGSFQGMQPWPKQ